MLDSEVKVHTKFINEEEALKAISEKRAKFDFNNCPNFRVHHVEFSVHLDSIIIFLELIKEEQSIV